MNSRVNGSKIVELTDTNDPTKIQLRFDSLAAMKRKVGLGFSLHPRN